MPCQAVWTQERTGSQKSASSLREPATFWDDHAKMESHIEEAQRRMVHNQAAAQRPQMPPEGEREQGSGRERAGETTLLLSPRIPHSVQKVVCTCACVSALGMFDASPLCEHSVLATSCIVDDLPCTGTCALQIDAPKPATPLPTRRESTPAPTYDSFHFLSTSSVDTVHANAHAHAHAHAAYAHARTQHDQRAAAAPPRKIVPQVFCQKSPCVRALRFLSSSAFSAPALLLTFVCLACSPMLRRALGR